MDLPPARIRALLAALILGALMVFPAAAAEKAQLRVSPRLAAGGALRAMRPAAIAVEVENSGGDFKGEIRYSPRGDETVWTLPIRSPGRSRRLHFVPFFAGQSGSISGTVSLVDENGDEALPGVTVGGTVGGSRCVLGAASRSKESGMRALLSKRDWRSGNLLVSFDPGELPDSWQGLAPYDVLFVWGNDFQALQPEGRAALRDWVLQGGVLVALPGVDPRSWEGSFVATALELDFGSWAEEQSSESLRRYVYTSDIHVERPGKFKRVEAAARRGESKVRQGGGLLADLVSIAPLCRGWVVFVAFDPVDPGIRDWGGLPYLWARLLASWLSVGYSEEDYDVAEAEDDVTGVLIKKAAPPRSILLIALAVLAYGILIGPVEYLFWRKVGRPRLSLVTFPLMVILCSAGALWIGSRMKGSEIIKTEITVEDIDPVTGDVLAESNLGIYSPAPGTVRFDSGPDSFVSEFGTEGSTFTGRFALPCLLGPGGRITARMPVGGSRFFRSTAFDNPDRRPVTVKVFETDYLTVEGLPEGTEFEVEVVNDSQAAIESCSIYSGDLHVLGPKVLLLKGSVSAGKTRRFRTVDGDIKVVPLVARLSELELKIQAGKAGPGEVFQHLAFSATPAPDEWRVVKKLRGLFIGDRLRHEVEAYFTAWTEGAPPVFGSEETEYREVMTLRWMRMRLDPGVVRVNTITR